MQLTLALVALSACRHPTAVPVPHETGGPPPATTTTATDHQWIPPSVQLHGEPGQLIHSNFAAFRAHGGHPGTLFVTSGAQPEPYPQTWAHFPRMFVVSGDLPRGVHPITDVWDGESSVPFMDGFAAAGDVDRDGHMDVWCNNRKLYRGPFLGRELSDDQVLAEAECCWVPMLGDFDADGDGELDALLGGGQRAHIYYGPFEGTLPLWVDDPDITSFAYDAPACTSHRGAFRIEGYFGPGADAIGVGGGPGDGCHVETRFYELHGPRGRRLSTADAFSESESGHSGVKTFVGLDVDGDGRSEVLAGMEWLLQVYQNPIAPWFRDTPKAWDIGGRFVTAVVGDVNGDGFPDLIADVDEDGDDEETWLGLVPGPFDTTRPIDASVAIPLTPTSWGRPDWREVLYHTSVGRIALDLDGDGLIDLVDLNSGPDWAGYISIWYGADLVPVIDQWREP